MSAVSFEVMILMISMMCHLPSTLGDNNCMCTFPDVIKGNIKKNGHLIGQAVYDLDKQQFITNYTETYSQDKYTDYITWEDYKTMTSMYMEVHHKGDHVTKPCEKTNLHASPVLKKCYTKPVDENNGYEYSDVTVNADGSCNIAKMNRKTPYDFFQYEDFEEDTHRVVFNSYVSEFHQDCTDTTIG